VSLGSLALWLFFGAALRRACGLRRDAKDTALAV
jgi:hypothetical protein